MCRKLPTLRGQRCVLCWVCLVPPKLRQRVEVAGISSARAEAGTSHQQQQQQPEDAGQDEQVPDNLLLPAAGLLQPAPCLQAGGLALASLPQLVLATILDLLSVGDVVRLSQVDRWGVYSDTLYIL